MKKTKTKQDDSLSSFECLERLLCEVPEYAIEDKINKNLVAELARKYDSKLINTLLSNKTTKKLFFVETDAGMMFKRDTFLQFISQKEFLPDSYTRFSQRIGLAVGDNYLADDSRVVLDWPYKDCVLEGGQTKEDQKRDEVFFNEILAPDQINTILADKVFTNWKRYDKDGEHELDKLKPSDNLIIKGNNLVVLYSLKKRFAGRVKLIYIDPPYNTGNDGFNYNDTFNHSTWLTFMRNRLMAAKDLLSNDGMVFVQCDDNEQAYLKLLMDELFDFRECIIVNTSTPSGVNAVNVKRGERLFKLKEYILFYSKAGSARFNPLLVKSDYNLNYKYELKDDGTLADISKNFSSTEDFVNYCLKNSENIYSIEKNNKKAGEKVKAIIESSKGKKKVIRAKNSKGDDYLVYDGGVLTPLASRVVEDNGKFYFGTLISDLWADEVFQSNKTEGGVELPGGKKPEKLIRRIIDLATNPNDIVLDYHLGSGTTAAVAHKMGRQYIGVEQLNYDNNDSVVRLQNVINGDTTGISKTVGWKGGGSFVYCNIKNDANVFRERVKDADEKELDKLLDEVLKSSFLSYRVDPKKVTKSEFNKLSKAEKKRVLMELVDNNTLYLNYSEIDDKTYNISEADKKHNKEFYGEK